MANTRKQNFVLWFAIALCAVAFCLAYSSIGHAEAAPGIEPFMQPMQTTVKKALHHHGKRSKATFAKGSKFIAGAPSNIVIVPTMAGIDIQVNSASAAKFQAFIADLVAAGYVPHQIHGYASGGHVHNSYHYRGDAIDIDGSANKVSALRAGRVRAIAMKHGLRDGCEFHDCGHYDTGKPIKRYARRSRRIVAAHSDQAL